MPDPIDDPNAPLTPIFQLVGAFPLVSGSKDAAILQFLEPGAYTVILEPAA